MFSSAKLTIISQIIGKRVCFSIKMVVFNLLCKQKDLVFVVKYPSRLCISFAYSYL